MGPGTLNHASVTIFGAANCKSTTLPAKAGVKKPYAIVPASKTNGFLPGKINRSKGLFVSELEQSGFQTKN